jgi:hypothetical protein
MGKKVRKDQKAPNKLYGSFRDALKEMYISVPNPQATEVEGISWPKPNFSAPLNIAVVKPKH